MHQLLSTEKDNDFTENTPVTEKNSTNHYRTATYRVCINAFSGKNLDTYSENLQVYSEIQINLF
jgi:hypothetical protein